MVQRSSLSFVIILPFLFPALAGTALAADKWSKPMELPVPPKRSGGIWGHDLAEDPEGRIHAVYGMWVKPGSKDPKGRYVGSIFHTIWDGKAWSDPERISRKGEISSECKIVIGKKGIISVVWLEGRSAFKAKGVCARRFLPEAGGWQPVTLLPLGPVTRPLCARIFISSEGQVYIAYVYSQLEDKYYRLTVHDGEKWNEIENSAIDDFPVFADNGKGFLWRAWPSKADDGIELQYRKFLDSKWKSCKKISAPGQTFSGYQNLALEVDEEGKAHLAFQASLPSEGRWKISHVFYTHEKRSRRSWSKPVNLQVSRKFKKASSFPGRTPLILFPEKGAACVAWLLHEQAGKVRPPTQEFGAGSLNMDSSLVYRTIKKGKPGPMEYHFPNQIDCEFSKSKLSMIVDSSGSLHVLYEHNPECANASLLWARTKR
jgi:hypothetical protein